MSDCGEKSEFNCDQLGLAAEDYEFGSHLGDGGFGRVYQATCKRTGKPVAIKVGSLTTFRHPLCTAALCLDVKMIEKRLITSDDLRAALMAPVLISIDEKLTELHAGLFSEHLSGSMFSSVTAVGGLPGRGSSEKLVLPAWNSRYQRLDKRKVHQRNMTSRVISEISIHQRLRHQFVLQLYSYFEDTANVYIVLELCQGGNLHDYVRRNGCLSEDKVRYFLKQIVAGLCYLHRSGIIHRDLTLANLLLTEDCKVKISDFGLAAELSEDRTNKTMCGTPNYISPEVSSQGVQGPEVDVWSLGVMLYTMLVGKAPFDTKDPKSTIDNARRLKYDIPGSLHPEAIDLIAKLLRERPKERLTLAQVLQHPFMRDKAHASVSLSRPQLHQVEQRQHRPAPAAASTPHLQTAASLRRCHSDGRQAGGAASNAATAATGGVLAGHSRHSEGYSSAVQSEGSPLGPQAAPRLQQLQQHQQPLDTVSDGPQSCASSNPTSSLGSQRGRRLPQNPLSTARLEPCRVVKGPTVFSLTADGDLTVEQFKVGGRKSTPPRRVLRIEPDGRHVALISEQQQQDSLDWSSAEKFIFPDLPDRAARLYQLADSFISILRSNTAKVVLHTDRARCVLFENSEPEPDFAVYFYNGRRAGRRNGGLRMTVDGKPIELRSLSPDEAEILHYVNETFDQVKRVESALAALSSPGRCCFPATIGRAPADSGLEPATSSSKSTPTPTPVPIPTQPLLQVADVQQLSDNDTRVLFSDGSLLEIRQDGSEQLRSLDYTDPFGHRQRLESSQRRPLADTPLPADIQRRLGLLLLGKVSTRSMAVSHGCSALFNEVQLDNGRY
uniref:Serine/threonine-protein kinase PLK4 n=1 Tax=Macrostomum lignano TaxID=282301 RepID=A0A1I8HFB9_9PLAT